MHETMRRLAFCVLMGSGAATVAAPAAPPPAAPTPAASLPAAAQEEITHLLDYLGTSGCSFGRGGTWYDAGAARKHLAMKLDYLVKRQMVATADDFLKLAATSSSMSGQIYRVRCGAEPAAPSADWLGAELARFRVNKVSSAPK